MARGGRHVTPSGHGESWRRAGGSGGGAGPGPGSGGHGRARAMVRAGGAGASAAGAAAMLGAAVPRAALQAPLHKPQAGQQQAASAGTREEMKKSEGR